MVFVIDRLTRLIRGHVVRAGGAEVIGDVTERGASASESRAVAGELGEEGDFAETRRKRDPDVVSAGATIRRGRGGVSGHVAGTRAELGVRRGVPAGILHRHRQLGEAFAAVVQFRQSSCRLRHPH